MAAARRHGYRGDSRSGQQVVPSSKSCKPSCFARSTPDGAGATAAGDGRIETAQARPPPPPPAVHRATAASARHLKDSQPRRKDRALLRRFQKSTSRAHVRPSRSARAALVRGAPKSSTRRRDQDLASCRRATSRPQRRTRQSRDRKRSCEPMLVPSKRKNTTPEGDRAGHRHDARFGPSRSAADDKPRPPPRKD